MTPRQREKIALIESWVEFCRFETGIEGYVTAHLKRMGTFATHYTYSCLNNAIDGCVASVISQVYGTIQEVEIDKRVKARMRDRLVEIRREQQ